MSMLYLAQPDQQQQLDWLAGGTLAILLDSAATDGQLMMGRFDVAEGEALAESAAKYGNIILGPPR